MSFQTKRGTGFILTQVAESNGGDVSRRLMDGETKNKGKQHQKAIEPFVPAVVAQKNHFNAAVSARSPVVLQKKTTFVQNL
jgi:hypothetical protein